MADTDDLTAAISELDDGYLQAELLLAVGRAGREEPRRAGFWHALAGLLASEQQRRRQGEELTGPAESSLDDGAAAAIEHIREQLRLDSQSLAAQYADATGGFPAPAGEAPPVASVDEVTAPAGDNGSSAGDEAADEAAAQGTA